MNENKKRNREKPKWSTISNKNEPNKTNQPAILLKFHMKYLWLKRCDAKEERQWKCTLVMTTTPNGLLNNVARLFLCRQRIFSVNKHLRWIIFNAKCQNLGTQIKWNEKRLEKIWKKSEFVLFGCIWKFELETAVRVLLAVQFKGKYFYRSILTSCSVVSK